MHFKNYLFVFAFLALHIVGLQKASSQIQSHQWYNPSQEYFKVEISKAGIYQISYSALAAQTNTDVSNINPENFQLFRLGNEKPIEVLSGNDGQFGPGDAIRFYGEKNDGTLDSGLYLNPEDQPHQHYSLYTDTAAYFLTWQEGVQGKRYSIYEDTNYQTYTPEEYFMKESITLGTNNYNIGDPILNLYDNFLLGISYYTSGEGWASKTLNPWGAINFDIDTRNHFSPGPDPKAEVLLYGVSRWDSAGYTSGIKYHHHTRIRLNGNILEEHLHSGFDKVVRRYNLNPSDIQGATSSFSFKTIGKNTRGLTADYSKVFYTKITYPRHFSLDASLPFQFSLDKTKNNYFVKFPEYPNADSLPILYDLTTSTRIKGAIENDSLKAIIPGSTNKQDFFLTDSVNVTTVQPKKVKFQDYDQELASNMDYLIITHPKLYSAANQYANYRTSSGKNVEVTNVKQLYNHYSFGIHHPLGIRYFLKHLANEGHLPEQLLLLGKGLQNDKVRQGSLIQDDLIPSIGFPPSDNLYALNLKNPEGFDIDLEVGRIPARSNEDVLNYLAKLRDYENQLKMAETQGGQTWRKNLMHISGGKDQQENNQYRNYLNHYASIAKDTSIGAQIQNLSKNKSIPIDGDHKDFFIESINEGLSLVTYFGHGAAEVLEVDIGEPTEYTQNKGNYPVFFFSGCILGNTYSESPGMADRFILNDDQGGILWIAESHFSFVNNLNQYSTAFYENLGRKQYGNTIGSVLKGTISDFKNPGNYRNEMQVLQKTLQGDPAVRIYSPSEPDYSTSVKQVKFLPRTPDTKLDSFGIQLVIDNAGKAIKDSLEINIQQTFPDFSQAIYDSIYTLAPYSRDTFIYYIKPNNSFAGENQFQIQLDPNNSIDELNESNNTANINQFFPSSGIRPIFPKEYAIIPKQQANLTAQSNNLFAENLTYLFELDQTHRFNSSFLKQSGPIQGDAQLEWSSQLLSRDSSVYYWRTKQKTEDQSISWESSSFMYINNSRPGWAQGNFNQMLSANTQNLTIDTSEHVIYFNREVSGRYNILSTGVNSNSTYAIRYEGSRLFNAGANQGIYILAINPNKQERFCYQSPYNNQGAVARGDGHEGNKSCVFIFDWVQGGSIDTSVVEDFMDHVDTIPEGYNVLAFTASEHLFNDMWEDFYQSMDNLGSGIIRKVGNGWPYILLGQKGADPGSAMEKTADTALPLDPTKQDLDATHTSYPLSSEGTMTSSLIGPSKNWYNASIETSSMESPTSDSLAFKVKGVTPEGQETTLLQNLSEGSHDISSIDAEQYPYLKLEAFLQDTAELTAPQIQNWIVTHDHVPEGSLQPNIAMEFYDDSLQQGDSIRVKFAYQNISDFQMDSVLVSFRINDDQNQPVIDEIQRYENLDPQDTLIASKMFSTDHISGKNQFRLNINPDFDQPEQYRFNNVYTKDFYVSVDKTDPLLDVTFNGKHIMDGAIVNPQPEIRITSKDDNPFYLMDDTSNINAWLETPNGQEKKLEYGTELEFYPAKDRSENKATVFYQPEGKLGNGTYQLKVKAKDGSGNRSGKVQYKKRFEVINESTITHLYPYPNPFTSRMRFVFTLTGSQVPDKINIQIMTITGKVVKEITKQALGPLRIGVNKTNWVWDGTDQYGDALGNGVYFYRVKAYLNGEPIEHRETAGDQFFEKDIGKLYLMR